MNTDTGLTARGALRPGSVDGRGAQEPDPINSPINSPTDSPIATPAALARLVRARPPSAGPTRLVAVDGRSGSGKTTLADDLGAELNAPVIHLDDVYEGWQGLPGIAALLHEWIVVPLLQGRPARWRPYHWDTGTRGDYRTLPASPVVVLEGCGSGSAPLTDHLALLIWVDVADDVRLERLRSRPDWPLYRDHYRDWAEAESVLLEQENTPGRADVVIRNDISPPGLHLLNPRIPTA